MASVYVLSDGFCVERLVRFDLPSQSKALDRVDKGVREEVATVLAIPDDVEGTEEQFDPEDPPCEDDFSNMTEQVKHVRRWTAALDMTYAQNTDKTKNKLIPMWYPSGAAVLLQLSALKYAVIGREAYTFEMQPRDEVVDFRVSMHSPDVLEPVAWIRGRKNTYLLNLRQYAANATLFADEAQAERANPYGLLSDDVPLSDIRNVTNDIRAVSEL